MDNFKIILRQPSTWIFIIAFLFAIVIHFEDDKGEIEREEWIVACHDLGGVTIMDDYSRGIGDSLCLKPNSIITVAVPVSTVVK